MSNELSRTARELLRRVKTMLLREFLGFEGPVDIAMRADGEPPDRSVFAAARLPSCDTVAVVRVYERDLDRDPLLKPTVVYLAAEDADLLQGVLAPRRSRRRGASSQRGTKKG